MPAAAQALRRQFHLDHAADVLPVWLERAAHEEVGYPDFLRGVLEEEVVAGASTDRKMRPSESQLRAQAQVPPPAPPPVEAAPPAPAPSAPSPAEPRFYGAEQPGIIPPVAIRQVVPPLPGTVGAIGFPKGLYDLTIDERGRVVGVIVRRSIHRNYDNVFIEAAARWQYQPAILDGRPVRYRKSIQVAVSR